MGSSAPIYLDHAAATPVRPEVREAMSPFLEETVGNPSSLHRWGRQARRDLEAARDRVAAVMGVASGEVLFVRGGTESINLAILGWADWIRATGGSSPQLMRSSVEHSSVREAMDAAESAGCSVTVLDVEPNGGVEVPSPPFPTSTPALLSVQWVNHETGLVLDIGGVAEASRAAGALLHVDAVQAVGKMEMNSAGPPGDLLSFSGHKLGGPRGTGVLLLRSGVELRPRLFGGGQEAGLRPGTEDVAGAVGLATALEIATDGACAESGRMARLRSRLEHRLAKRFPTLKIHGKEGARAPHILGIGVPGVPRDVLPGALDLEGVAVSSGSACRSGSTAVSPVLRALYGPRAEEVAPLRFSLGWSTTEAEVDLAVERTAEVLARLWNA